MFRRSLEDWRFAGDPVRLACHNILLILWFISKTGIYYQIKTTNTPKITHFFVKTIIWVTYDKQQLGVRC